MNSNLEKIINYCIISILLLYVIFFVDIAYCVPLVLDPETKLNIFSQYIINKYDNGQNIVEILKQNETLRTFVLSAENESEIRKIADIYCNGFDEGVSFSVKHIVFR